MFQLEFPAVTICGQGMSEDVFVAGFFKLFFKFKKKIGAKSFEHSPITSAIVFNKVSLSDMLFRFFIKRFGGI